MNALMNLPSMSRENFSTSRPVPARNAAASAAAGIARFAALRMFVFRKPGHAAEAAAES